MPLVCIRGATTCSENTAPSISRSTRELIHALASANPSLVPSSALAAIVTATPDLDAGFPAAAFRELGYTETSLLGAVEAAVPGAPPRCIRVLVFYGCDDDGNPVPAGRGTSVYLHGATLLRPDLKGRADPQRDGGDNPCS